MFDGATFDENLDGERLSTLLVRVRSYMLNGGWATLSEIATASAAGSEASVSARLRDLRTEKFGSFTVDRRRRGDPKNGLHEYRVRESNA